MDLLKNNWKKVLILIICSAIIPILVEKFYYDNQAFSFDRFIIFYFCSMFLIMNLMFDRKKIWEFVYKFRILICVIIFGFLVAFGYHGSSLGLYDYYVEPETKIFTGMPIMGELRSIRSDEWMVSSMMILSQNTDANNYSRENNTMMGKTSNVGFYPKLPIKSISIITTPDLIGFLFLPLEQAFSFHWFFGFFALFIASFELFMIITKQKKIYSLLGAILVLFSPAVQWWESTTMLYSGMLAIVFFDKFLNSKNIKMRILYSLLIGFCGSIYITTMYPAWMVPYAYFFLGLVIWELVLNKKKYNIKDILLLVLIASGVICLLVIPEFLKSRDVFDLVNNTVYPGARFSTGGRGWEHLFKYILSVFLPFYGFSNPSEASSLLSLYPIPLIMGIMYIFIEKKNKKDLLLIILVIVELFLTIWNFLELPSIVSKVTLLYMSTEFRTPIVASFVSIVLLVYCLANYNKKVTIRNNQSILCKIFLALFITIYAISVIGNMYPTEYTQFMKNISLVMFTLIGSLALVNSSKTHKVLIPVLIFMTVIPGIAVHPLTRGLDMVYEKPFAKKVQKIVKKNPDSLWATVDTGLPVSNYMLANGAKVLNSTNYYPNTKLWKILDGKNKYEDIWNRYAHMNIGITNEKTSVELLLPDYIQVKLDVNDICKIGIDYIASSNSELENLSNKEMNVLQIYSHENMFIYDVDCD